MVSSIDNGTTTKEFVFQNAVPKLIIQESFIADKPDKSTEITNPPIIRKTYSVSGFLISDEGGGDSAAVKFYEMADYLVDNFDTELTLTLDLDGGDLTKTHNGKIIGEFNGVIAERSVKVVPITFNFVLSDADWGS